MTGKIETSCPACEYNHGKRGKPTQLGGELVCLDCGNRWKELGQSQLLQAPGSSDNRGELSLAQLFEPGNVGAATRGHETFAKASKKAGFRGVFFTASALATGILSVIVFLDQNTGSKPKKGLHVADLQFEELVRKNRGKVVRVSGTINNSGAVPQRVKRLALVLRKSNGSELTRWYYNSHVGKLQPGGKSRFVSSIQYDTPVIASVDAIFE